MENGLKSSAHLPTPVAGPGEPLPKFVSAVSFIPDSAEAQRAYAHWSSRPKSASGVPALADFDLLEIPDALPSCLLLDLESPTRFMVRLFGTGLVERYGGDLTGVNAYDLFEPVAQEAAEYRIKVLREGPAILHSKNGFKNENNIPLVTEWTFLPLIGASGDIDHALVTIVVVEAGPYSDMLTMNATIHHRRIYELNIAVL